MTAVSVSFVRDRTLSRGEDSISFADVLAFLVPALLGVNFQIGGRLFVSELVLFAALPFLLAGSPAVRTSPWVRAVVAAGFLWLWAQIVTDLYHSTPFSDLARGWLNVAFTLADFVGILILISGRRRRIILFTAGLAVGYALQYRFNPSPYADVDPWKFGVAIPVTLLIVLLSCQTASLRIRVVPCLLLLFAGILNFAFGFRSLGGICVLAGVYLAAQGFASRPSSSLKILPTRVIAFCLIGGVFALLLVAAYGRVARDGFLGTPAAQKYSQQSSGKFGVLLGGRPELFVSSRAIADSPLIGHGSWAKDPKYTNDLLSVLYQNGYRPSGDLLYAIHHSKFLIPSHSYLFQSWVDAGLLGAVFWMIVLALALSTLILVFRSRPSLSPLIAFLAILLVWNIFFSPYGADQRIFAMFTVAVLLTCRRLPVEVRQPPAFDQFRVGSSKVARSRATAW